MATGSTQVLRSPARDDAPVSRWVATDAGCRRVPSPPEDTPQQIRRLRRSIPLRPSLVGRAVIARGHHNGGVVLLMWANLAYLDRYGYDYVTDVCPSTNRGETVKRQAAGCVRLRDHPQPACAPPRYARWPLAVRVDGRSLDDILHSATASVPHMMRGCLKTGRAVPGINALFGVGDFLPCWMGTTPNTRYLRRLRSVAAASEMVNDARRPPAVCSPWLLAQR